MTARNAAPVAAAPNSGWDSRARLVHGLRLAYWIRHAEDARQAAT